MDAVKQAVAEKVLEILVSIVNTDEVKQNPDLNLFDAGIIDSLGMVQLMVALSEQLGVAVSPAEIERQDWETPRKIIGYVENRIGK